MGQTQLLKILVAAPDPEYPDDGYEVEEIRYLDGHEDAPRICTCCPEKLQALQEQEREEAKIKAWNLWSKSEHLPGCPEISHRLTDAEWADDDIGNNCFGHGCADYLWGDATPPAAPRFWVIGYCWAERDYWGECDGGFELEGFEEYKEPACSTP
jgi:hypothetical protein